MCEALGYLEPKYKVRDHALPVVSARLAMLYLEQRHVREPGPPANRREMFEDEAAHLMHNCSLMWRHHPALGENESVQSALRLGANGEAFDEALRAYRARWARDHAAARSALSLRQEEDRKHRAREAQHARLLLNCRMAGMHAAGGVPGALSRAPCTPNWCTPSATARAGRRAPEHWGFEVRSFYSP